MVLIGCVFVALAALAPRILIVLAWIFSDKWAAVWGDQILAPLAGLILAPYTTIMVTLAATVTPTGVTIDGISWLWIGLGVFLDLWKWSGIIQNRQVAAQYGGSIYKSQR